MNVHHVGYAVSSVSKAFEEMKSLGFAAISDVVDDEERNVRILLLANGSYRVELVAPLDPGKSSPVDGVLAKKAPGPYHFCYEVENLAIAIQDLKEKGFSLFQSPSPARALDSEVAFLFHRELGIIELVQAK